MLAISILFQPLEYLLMCSTSWPLLSLAALVCMAATSVSVAEELRLPSVFGDHMVLQREMPVPVWGWAEPGEQVGVTFRDQSLRATADGEGRWSVELAALTVGEPDTLTVTSEDGRVMFEDVLVGEVWVCSGQSNMWWPVERGLDPDLETAAGQHPHIRLFQVPRVTATEPQEDVEAEWTLCTPETVPDFSAVAYYYGRNLQQVLQVPIGLVHTSWGGTRAEAWTSPEMMASVDELKPIVETWEERAAAYDPDEAREWHEAAVARWERKAAAARAEGTPVPRRPRLQRPPRQSPHHPSTLFNAMVAPLSPVAVRGAIWYQGESNASRAYQYRTLMPAMIQSWRNDWQQGDFPFYMVQLANFREPVEESVASDWAELREAQMMTTEALPNVGVACITDLGAAKDIHPKNKQDVGKRLARLALVDVYGYRDRIVRNGPVYESVTFADGKAIVHFETLGSPLATYYNEPLTGFAIAGQSRNWVNAEGRIIDGHTLEVSNPHVPDPVAVRYNWADNPQGNLYNSHLLPAYPFRTDDWPGVTVNNVKP